MVLNRNVFYTATLLDENVVSLARFAKVVDRKTIFIVRQVSTLKEHQDKGYAKKCIEAGYDYIKSKGGKKIYNSVNKDNIASIKLHKKCGFRMGTPTKHMIKWGYCWEDAYMFEKDLVD